MIVTLSIPAATRRKIDRGRKAAARVDQAMAAAMGSAVAVGAEEVRAALQTGDLGITARHGGLGLAGAVTGWMLDASAPLGAIGVPANSPAAAYAAIQERGGVIRPRNAKMLAVPVSDEAKRYSSPRDMQGLTLIPRKGRPPLLVRMLAARGGRRANWQIHWVLLASVTIRASRWLSEGVDRARPEMAAAFGDRMGEWTREW